MAPSTRGPPKLHPTVTSLIAGDRKETGGILCNDPSGLCLMSKGHILEGNPNQSGVFTNLVRLAAKLQPAADGATDSAPPPAPLITIETDTASILVKEYDGHAVAIQVPTVDKQDGANGS